MRTPYLSLPVADSLSFFGIRRSRRVFTDSQTTLPHPKHPHTQSIKHVSYLWPTGQVWCITMAKSEYFTSNFRASFPKPETPKKKLIVAFYLLSRVQLNQLKKKKKHLELRRHWCKEKREKEIDENRLSY